MHIIFQIPVVTLKNVNKYLEIYEQSIRKKIKKLYSKKWIVTVRFSMAGNITYISGRVRAQLKRKLNYAVDVSFDGHGIVQQAQCECGAGMGPHAHCKHVMIILYGLTFAKQGILTHETCTQRLQTFHQVKPFTGSPKKMQSLELRKKGLQALKNFDPRPQSLQSRPNYKEDFRNAVVAHSNPRISMKQLWLGVMEELIVRGIVLSMSNEVRGSYHMEKEGLIRCLDTVMGHDLQIGIIVTNRQLQIAKFIREELQGVIHIFDIRHVAKGFSQNWESASKLKMCLYARDSIAAEKAEMLILNKTLLKKVAVLSGGKIRFVITREVKVSHKIKIERLLDDDQYDELATFATQPNTVVLVEPFLDLFNYLGDAREQRKSFFKALRNFSTAIVEVKLKAIIGETSYEQWVISNPVTREEVDPARLKGRGTTYRWRQRSPAEDRAASQTGPCVLIVPFHRYPAVKNYLQNKVINECEEWALCFRKELPTRGNNTNNFAEATMGVLKDKVFLRTKAFNVPQLLAFLTTRMEDYYTRRLIDVANNRMNHVLQSRFLGTASTICGDKIVRSGNETFDDPSEKDENTSYAVDMSVGLCSCPVRSTGGPCKHQFAVVQQYNIASHNFLPTTSSILRAEMHKVATGEDAPPEWFANLGSYHTAQALPTADLPCSNMGNEFDMKEEMEHEDLDGSKENIDPELIQKASDALKIVFQHFQEQLESDPAQMLEPVLKFASNCDELTTQSALISAMTCFGKYAGAAASLKARRQSRLQTSKTIRVQPTALARRKMLVGGRKRMALGRQPFQARAINHSKRKEPGVFASAIVPKRAPHNLSSCVSSNNQLGKTHSCNTVSLFK
ncbi:hypothetical protein CAPTEDRAFT_223758 [Capitella teleta]|uniref:SWIM-type domain-containing protein n=1 Tax=Capitella teleta TaxID=283909 RepID=R7TBA2_CAPTE|nr:hypothetical protein CAPTEDRAFT_223758 [Capitella teleta]|eukprot:ELT91018.1 hypothetical protein CAPTEDRAFT_223758 [Capitella teleta]